MRSNMGKSWTMTDEDTRDAKTAPRVSVTPIRTSSAKSLVEAAHAASLQKKKTDCRELVQSNLSIPSIHLHCSTCVCPPPSPRDATLDDESLSSKIRAASAAIRARSLSSPGSSPKLASLAALQSVSRWITGSTNTASTSELPSAVSALDITKTTHLILSGSVPINARDPSGTPPLIALIRSHLAPTHPLSHLAMASLLLDAGADPNTTTSPLPAGSMSALAAAAALGHVALVNLLLSRGAAIDARATTMPMSRSTGHGLTALHAAVSSDRQAVAETLISLGASVHVALDGYRSLASPPGSPGRRDRKVWTAGVTALHLSASNPAITSFLLRYRADTTARDSFGRTPLHWAMSGANVDVVKMLLAAGTEVDVLDDDGATPLAVLVGRLEMGEGRKGHEEVVRELLEAGANADLRYPGDLSLRGRVGAMERGKGAYGEIFERYGLGSPRLGGRFR